MIEMSSLGGCLRGVVAFESLDDIGWKFALIIISPGEQCEFCFPKIEVVGNKIHCFPRASHLSDLLYGKAKQKQREDYNAKKKKTKLQI